jgi:alkylated DNA repair dioxygenase AlkB
VTQQDLFVPSLPEGFLYQPDFLALEEEADLLRAIAREPFEAMDYHGFKARRRTVEFGLEYDFGTHRTSATRGFPAYILPLRERAAAFAGLEPAELVEAIFIEYPPGAPIGWHRDAPQFGTVIGISLLHAARMRLKPYSAKASRSGSRTKNVVNSVAAAATKQAVISVTLEPRSIYVLRGAARWQWQHSVPPVEELRYSITFRTLRAEEVRKRA